MSSFPGFPKDLFVFLKELSANNNREWFQDNKSRYIESIADPMSEFIMCMGEKLEKYADGFYADPRRNGGSMFRIYRDVRFSKDKRPYKENVSCQFRHSAGKDAHAPGFYLHIESGNVFVGGGVWMPPNSVLFNIRTRIVEKEKEWVKIKNSKAFREKFGEISGDGLVRPPKGFDANHPQIVDLKRKSFFITQSVRPNSILQPDFPNEVNKIFKSASPLMKFLTQSVDLPFHTGL